MRQSPAAQTYAEFGFLAALAGGRDDRAMVDAGGLFAQAFSIGLLSRIAAEPTVQEALREPEKFSTIGRAETGELNLDSRHWHVFQAVRGFLEKSGEVMQSDSVADVMRIVAEKLHEQLTHEAAVGDGDKAGSQVNVPNDLEKRVESLERQTKKPPKPPTKTERIRDQRIKFCCPKRRKKSQETWNEIYHAYNKKFPNDKTASPDTLLHSHDRNCLKCREQKS